MTTKEDRQLLHSEAPTMKPMYSRAGLIIRLINHVDRLEAENAGLVEIAERLRSGILDYSDHTVKCSYRPPTSFDAVNGGNVPGIPCDCGLDQLMIETDAALQPQEPTP